MYGNQALYSVVQHYAVFTIHLVLYYTGEANVDGERYAIFLQSILFKLLSSNFMLVLQQYVEAMKTSVN